MTKRPTKEYDVLVKFEAESYAEALTLARNNLSDNAIQVARIVELNPHRRLISELLDHKLTTIEPLKPLPPEPTGVPNGD